MKRIEYLTIALEEATEIADQLDKITANNTRNQKTINTAKKELAATIHYLEIEIAMAKHRK